MNHPVDVSKPDRAPILLLVVVFAFGAYLFWPSPRDVEVDPVALGRDAVVVVDSTRLANSLMLDELCDKNEVELRRIDSGASMENVEPDISTLFHMADSPPQIVARIDNNITVTALGDDPLQQLESLLHER